MTQARRGLFLHLKRGAVLRICSAYSLRGWRVWVVRDSFGNVLQFDRDEFTAIEVAR
jgi:hypothetical protein